LVVDARPYSPFAAMLLSPSLSGGGVRESVAQPVRRCITHLLPVRPTCVGRTNLTSQGAPKRVSRGEPCHRQRICPTRQLPPDAESVNSRRRPFLLPFPRVFLSPPLFLSLSPAHNRVPITCPEQRPFWPTNVDVSAESLPCRTRRSDAELTYREATPPTSMADNGRFCHVLKYFVTAVINQTDRSGLT
jgi:hypothetical protein